MRNLTGLLVYTVSLALILTTGCIGDYDIGEVAPSEHLDMESDHHDHDENEHHDEDESCTECEAEADHSDGSTMEQISDEQQGGPSRHSHGLGVRNHGTQWFFNQPWAAPFIWGKLVRDGVVFLLLAAVLFLVTGRRRR